PIYTSLKVYCDASMLSDAVLQQEYLKCWRMAYIELKRNIYQRQIKEPGSAIKQFTTKRSHSFGDLSSYVVANASILAPALSAPSLSSSSSSITLNEDESVNGATSK